jgi:ribokinase
VILNAAPALHLPAGLLADIDVLVVNEHEAMTLAAALDLPDDPGRFVEAVAEQFGGAAVVTRGARGLVAASGKDRMSLAAPRITAIDTVGAGDALVGALAAALDRGAPLQDALKEGLAAGSLACARPGAQAALPDRAAIAALAATI